MITAEKIYPKAKRLGVHFCLLMILTFPRFRIIQQKVTHVLLSVLGRCLPNVLLEHPQEVFLVIKVGPVGNHLQRQVGLQQKATGDLQFLMHNQVRGRHARFRFD